MKKILFPTEFSAHAKNVFQYAVQFAHHFDAEIILLHVITDAELKILENQDLNDRGIMEIKQLALFAKKHIPAHYENVNFTCLAEVGFPQEAILQIAKDEDVDLIVMGMQGSNSTLDKMLGSISTAIIKEADCPVLAIPSDAKFSGIDHLIYALDFEFRDLIAINLLKDWGKFLNADIHCLHVMEGDEDTEIVSRNIETLYEIYQNKKRKIGKVTFEVLTGELEQSIIDFTNELDVDIFVMATHKRSLVQGLLQQNTTVQIANEIQVPLLVLKID